MTIDKVNPATAANAYANIQKTASSGVDGGDQTGGASFEDMVRKSVTETVDTLKGEEKASASAITGKGDLIDVIQATTNADMKLQTIVAARDRMLSAYQTIMNMPI